MVKRLLNSIRAKFEKPSDLFLILIIFVLVFSLARNITRINKASLKIQEAELRVEELKKENEELEKKLEVVKEEFVEKQLREKLGLAKEGEIVVILPDEEVLRKLAPSYEEEEETLPDPNWKKWLKLFL
jgi:cell division protein FtsB